MTQHQANFIRQLYSANRKKMLALMIRNFGDPDLAEDLVAAAFLTAMLKVEALMEHPDPARWLFRTLLYKSQQEARKLSRERTNAPMEELEAAPVWDEQGLTEILPAVLSKRDRQLLVWRFQQRQSYAYIAGQLGISELAAQRSVSRAVARCRRFLTALPDSPEETAEEKSSV